MKRVKLDRECQERARRMACRILRHTEDAEDAGQQAMLQAHKHRRSFKGNSSLTTWVTRIAVNEALMQLRKRRRDLCLDPLPDEPNFITPGLNPEARLQNAELRERLRRVIMSLPRRQQQAVLLRLVYGLSGEEAAETLGMHKNTIKRHLHRARTKLRGQLREVRA
jgi:RNA polymerase sigma-70 factor, ECF subfamily